MTTYKIDVTVQSALGFDTKFLFPGSVPHVTNYAQGGDLPAFNYRTVENGVVSSRTEDKLGTNLYISLGHFFGMTTEADGRDVSGATDSWRVFDEFDPDFAVLAKVQVSTVGSDFGNIPVPSFNAITLDSIVSAGLSAGDSMEVVLTGNTGNDTLRGSFWGDTLDGGAGNDSMIGGDGNDRYYVNTKKDKVVEASHAGFDSVYTKIDYTLSANLEGAVAVGGRDFKLTGNSRDNSLSGATGDDTLTGGSGNDTLAGSDGKDVLYGEGGKDLFMFVTYPVASTVDTVKDFKHADDSIVLLQDVFTGMFDTRMNLGYFALPADLFHASKSGKAHDASDRVIYDTDDGKLYFDPNGDAAGGRLLVAKFTGHPHIDASDIFII